MKACTEFHTVNKTRHYVVYFIDKDRIDFYIE